MGQPVTVIEKLTSLPGVIQYETNRVLSGMGHDTFTPDRPPQRNRPVDVLARRLLERGGIHSIHVNGNVITVRTDSHDATGIKEIVEDLYLYYPPVAAVAVAAETPALVAEGTVVDAAVVDAAVVDAAVVNAVEGEAAEGAAAETSAPVAD